VEVNVYEEEATNRSRDIHPLVWLTIGVGIGALGYALLEPDRGGARRAMIRDRAMSGGREFARGVQRRSKYIKDRTAGVIHDAAQRIREKDIPDDILEERVRAQLGRPVTNPRALTVSAHGGCVELSGSVLADEVGGLLRTVRRVRGVKEVVNNLDVVDPNETTNSLRSEQEPEVEVETDGGSFQTH
jgi:hypothetical protein